MPHAWWVRIDADGQPSAIHADRMLAAATGDTLQAVMPTTSQAGVPIWWVITTAKGYPQSIYPTREIAAEIAAANQAKFVAVVPIDD